MDTNKENTINSILSSLDGVDKANAPSFFYTRLKARMEKDLLPAPEQGLLLRPVYAFIALVVVISINAAVLFADKRGNETMAPADTELSQSIASEYNLNTNLTYEINQ